MNENTGTWILPHAAAPVQDVQCGMLWMFEEVLFLYGYELNQCLLYAKV